MKVCVITRHFVPNYGSLLQTIATCKSIEKFNCECEIIDYIREDEEAKNIKNSVIKQNGNWNKNLIKRFIYKFYQSFNFRLMFHFFNKRNKDIIKNKTKRYKKISELENDFPKCDILCSGSDQLWGPIGKSTYDPVYFLEFAPEDMKCISYAGSFGKTKLDKELLNEIKKMFKKYKHISVREESAKEILNKYEIDCDLVLDPTLLLTSNEWVSYMNLKKEKKQDYILVYQLHNNKNFDQYVSYLSKKTGLKVYVITSKLNNYLKKGKIIYLPKVQKFLNLIYNAKYIVTDSFHGTVFSIIFNKQFVSFTPGETSTRIKSLLGLFNLNDRYINNYSNEKNNMDNVIDWNKVNNLLDKMRKESLEWLNNALYK